MAILATTNWYVRAGGLETNGGGYDSTIAGATTNYADQDAPQLSLTDLATSGAGSTTLTSVTGGFTSAMIGNCIRIASGTNFQTGYYLFGIFELRLLNYVFEIVLFLFDYSESNCCQ